MLDVGLEPKVGQIELLYTHRFATLIPIGGLLLIEKFRQDTNLRELAFRLTTS